MIFRSGLAKAWRCYKGPACKRKRHPRGMCRLSGSFRTSRYVHLRPDPQIELSLPIQDIGSSPRERCLIMAKRSECPAAQGRSDLLDPIGLSDFLRGVWLRCGTSAAQWFCCGPIGIVLGTESLASFTR